MLQPPQTFIMAAVEALLWVGGRAASSGAPVMGMCLQRRSGLPSGHPGDELFLVLPFLPLVLCKIVLGRFATLRWAVDDEGAPFRHPSATLPMARCTAALRNSGWWGHRISLSLPESARGGPGFVWRFQVGDHQIRRLRNGDIYKGRYQGGKKCGEGVYAFVNGDVYQGSFQDDRMHGCGVYTFAHQARPSRSPCPHAPGFVAVRLGPVPQYNRLCVPRPLGMALLGA